MTIAKHGRRLTGRVAIARCAEFETVLREMLECNEDVEDVESRKDANPAEPVMLVRVSSGDTFRVTLAMVDDERGSR